jgi:hypothetical protein
VRNLFPRQICVRHPHVQPITYVPHIPGIV